MSHHEYERLDEDEAQDAFDEAYAGTFRDLAEWAEDFADSTGLLDSIPQALRFYFDYAAYGRDANLNGYIWTIDTPAGTAVFWSR